MNEIIKEFYRYRNGILADTLKHNGLPFNKIFGLIFPQLFEIASRYPNDINLSKDLWNDKDCRESRLLSILLIPIDQIKEKDIMLYIEGILTSEEVDLLCFKVLKRLPYVDKLLQLIHDKDILESKDLKTYLLDMLKKNLGKS